MSTSLTRNLPRKRPRRPLAAPRPQQSPRVHSAPLVASTAHQPSDDFVEVAPLDGDFVDISTIADEVHTAPVAPSLPQAKTPRPRPATAKKPTVSSPQAKAARAAAPTLVEPPVEGKRPKKRVHLTDNDLEILEAVNWMGRATIAHIAIAVDNTVENIRKRVSAHVSSGYLKVNKKHDMAVYGLAEAGAAVLENRIDDPIRVQSREPTKVRTKEWALGTLAHRNKINSALAFFKVGGNAFEERKTRELVAFAQEQERRRTRTRDSNAAMLERQERIRAIPEEQRTLSDHRYLNYRPQALAEIPEIYEPTRYPDTIWADPQAALPEDAIKLDIGKKGEVECNRDWWDATQRILSHPNYPVRHEGDSSPLSTDERQAEYDVMFRQSWTLQHWNNGQGDTKLFENRHLPDGVILRPHRVLADGTIEPRSIWLEVEENPKDEEAVKQVGLQAMDHPLIHRVLYLTNKKPIMDMVEEAKALMVAEILESLDFRREMNAMAQPMPEAEQKALVEKRVRMSIGVVEAPLVNDRIKSTGLWG